MLPDSLHRDLHVRQVVQRVEDAEDVHPAVGGVLDETGDDVVGIIRVTDGVGTAEEHLEKDVRHLFAELAEAFPRALVEETHRGVEGRAAPHFQGEHLRRSRGVGVGHGEHVVGAHPGGDERLVGVAHRSVGDEEALLVEDPLGEFLGAELFQQDC